MDRDHILYAVIGILLGFIAGYLSHEVMVQHQPPPATRLAAAGAGGGAAGAGAQATGAPAAGAAGQQPAMEQVQRLSQYVSENPDDTDALRLLANLNYDIQNWSRAAELYERYLGMVDSDPDVRTDLGISYRFLKRPDDALAEFRRVAADKPDYWPARYNEVLVLAFDLEDFDAARQVMEQLQTQQPENPDVARLAAELERRGG